MIGGDVDDRRRFGSQQVPAAMLPGTSAPSAATTTRSDGMRADVDVAPGCAAPRSTTAASGLDGGELALELGGRAGRVQRHGDGADAEDGQVAHDEPEAVVVDDRDPVALADAVGEDAAARPSDHVAELAVRGRLVPADDRHVVGVVALCDLSKIHRADAPLRVIDTPSSARGYLSVMGRPHAGHRNETSPCHDTEVRCASAR